MTETAVAEKVREIKAEDKAARRRARAAEDADLKARAEREVAAELRAADKAAKLALADRVEAVLRAARGPFAEIHTGTGHVVRVDLGGLDAAARGVGVEAVRRVAYQSAHRFAETVLGSRYAGEIVPEVDWLTPMLDSDAGLLHAVRKQVVGVRTRKI
jgi:membrane protein involved in colicin uptake